MEGKDEPEWFSISQAELEKNDVDPGIMFCEDCHQWHLISYRMCFEEKKEEVTRDIFGFFECKGNDFLWSINGKRVD